MSGCSSRGAGAGWLAATRTRCRSCKVYDVTGKVCWPMASRSTAAGFIFVPKGDLPITPSGVIGADGTFSLVTGGSGEGAPPGTTSSASRPCNLGNRPQDAGNPSFRSIQRRGQLGPRRHRASRAKSAGTDPAEVMGQTKLLASPHLAPGLDGDSTPKPPRGQVKPQPRSLLTAQTVPTRVRRSGCGCSAANSAGATPSESPLAQTE